MSAKKKYEYREKKNFNRDSEGLKRRRLKDENRWKFNPNESYESDNDLYYDDEDDFYDEEKLYR